MIANGSAKTAHLHEYAQELATQPRVRRAGGETLRAVFNERSGVFVFAIRHNQEGSESEIFVPNAQYPEGYQVEVSDGSFEIQRDKQTVIWRTSDKDMPHRLIIRPAMPRPSFEQPPIFWIGVAFAAFVLWLLLRPRR